MGTLTGKSMRFGFYLSQGKNAKLPVGVDTSSIVLRPDDRPVIYRNFIDGLSPRESRWISRTRQYCLGRQSYELGFALAE